jgi:hypothetical protein
MLSTLVEMRSTVYVRCISKFMDVFKQLNEYSIVDVFLSTQM